MENQIHFDPLLLLDSIYNGIVAIDASGIVVYFNKTAERILKTTATEAMGRYVLDVLPNTGGKIIESLQTGRTFQTEKLKGGGVELVSNISPVITDGAIAGVVSVFQDTSEIEAISKELNFFRDMKGWLDTIINSSFDGLWICDHEGNALMLNKASERINGVEAARVIGKNMRELVQEGMFDKSVTLEVLEKKAPVTMIQKVRGDKKILVTGNPIFNDNGDIVFVVANDRDMTELDNLRSQLQEAKALAKGYISKLARLQLEEADLSNIVFRSAEMQIIIEMAIRVAQVDSTILLLGESGAMYLGINSIKIKMQVFLLSTFPAGLIGGVYAYWITHIDPASVLGDLITDQAAVMAVFGTDSSGKCRNCSPLQTSPKSRGRETRLDDTRADRSCRPCRTTGRQPHAGQPQKAGGEQGAGAQSDAPASRRGCRRPQPYRSRPDH
jgi:PAS domain S-box-containing protein